MSAQGKFQKRYQSVMSMAIIPESQLFLARSRSGSSYKNVICNFPISFFSFSVSSPARMS